jgi:poly(3-hydroxybutyrate) depolymerase
MRLLGLVLCIGLYVTANIARAMPAGFNGIWLPTDRNFFVPAANQNVPGGVQHGPANRPPYQPSFDANYKATVAAARLGQVSTDPTARCLPAGMPRTMSTPFPFEISVERNRVLILFESGGTRWIWTDGRKHPDADDLDPTFMGDSVGHWEGETLVVETVGLRGDTVFDATGAPHSAQMRVKERIRLVSKDLLEDQMSIEDPVAFTHPWAVVHRYDRKAGWKIKEFVCEENNRGMEPGSTLAVHPVATKAPESTGGGTGLPLKKVMLSTGGVGMLGADRSYYYYVPAKIDRHGFNPVVFALRDNNESVEEFAKQSGWLKVAEDTGVVVVFPDPGAKGWSPYSGDEDLYLKSVYDHIVAHLTADDSAPQPRGQGERPAPGANAAHGAAPGLAGDEPAGAIRRPPNNRVNTWQPWQYMVGEGAGAIVAQEFTMSHPGLMAAIATLNAKAYPAAYDRSHSLAQGYFENQRGGKTATPSWRPQNKDVPVSAWMFTTGTPTPEQVKVANYWKRDNAVGKTAAHRTVGGLEIEVYTAASNPAQQVRTTTVAAARFDVTTTQAIWNDFFSRIARWTDSPNGTLGTMLPRSEVDKQFELKEAQVGSLTYQYYLKAPSNYRRGDSLPLVISLHGGTYPAWMYLSQIRMHEVGEREHFITVYLSGHNHTWNFIDPGSPDMQAIQNVIDAVVAQYGADRSRVYLQGFSFGSGLAHIEGLLRPQLFAAISPNSGIGDFSPPVLAAIDANKAQHDLQMPTIIFYGSVDAGGSTDGKIPAQGVLRTAIDFLKKYNHIDSPDRTERFESRNTEPYDVLLPSAAHSVIGRSSRYPQGRFNRYDYVGAAPQRLPVFSFVWVTDMPHGSDPAQAQMVWDYFKHWKRNPDGSLQYLAH